MYYGYDAILRWPSARTIRFRIAQPRAFHPNGPIREWECPVEDVVAWINDELVPIMNRAEMDHDLDAGPWCRFCPAKLICPLLTALFGAAAKADTKQIINLSNESLGRSYQYVQAVEFYLKAMKAETYRLLSIGKEVPGTKLVAKKANRVFKPGAQEVLDARLGPLAYSQPELKSPAEIEKMGGEAALLIKEWAYTPRTGETVALESDKRPGIKVMPPSKMFAAAVAALETDHE
jgi:hypothetical protein